MRILNRVAALAPRLPSLEPEPVLQAARRASGIQELGGDLPAEGLATLLRSADQDADLHLLGRLHLRENAVRALVQRARLDALRRQDPELERRPIRPPLIVCGLPRSGTTLLHRLLCELDDARPLPFWELQEPLPGPGPDRRLQVSRRRIAMLGRLVPVSLDAQHLIRPELPDECAHLFKLSFTSALYWQAPLYGWLDWWLSTDMGPAYRDWRALLSVLDVPGQRLTLKDPFHARHLPELFAVAPEALVVRLHRDPVEILPSFHRLTATAHAVVCRRPDIGRMVAANTRWLEDVARRTLAADDDPRVPGDRVLDVNYRDLLHNPTATVERICQRLGLPWRPEHAARIARYLAGHAQRRFGDNPYTAEEFGQTPDELRERFAAYREAYGLPGGSA